MERAPETEWISDATPHAQCLRVDRATSGGNLTRTAPVSSRSMGMNASRLHLSAFQHLLLDSTETDSTFGERLLLQTAKRTIFPNDDSYTAT